MSSEGLLQDRIRLALNHPEAIWWRNNCGYDATNRVRYGVGSPGGSDLIGMFRGRSVFAEVKTPTGRLSPDQVRFQNLVTSKGGLYVVLRSVEDAQALLARLAGG